MGSNVTTADTIAIREQLVAVLRAAEAPMTSAELASVLPWQTHRLDVGCELVCHAPRRPTAMRVVELIHPGMSGGSLI